MTRTDWQHPDWPLVWCIAAALTPFFPPYGQHVIERLLLSLGFAIVAQLRQNTHQIERMFLGTKDTP